jgi:hypothetical protein
VLGTGGPILDHRCKPTQPIRRDVRLELRGTVAPGMPYCLPCAYLDNAKRVLQSMQELQLLPNSARPVKFPVDKLSHWSKISPFRKDLRPHAELLGLAKPSTHAENQRVDARVKTQRRPQNIFN